MRNYQIHLIRHGRTAGNRQGRFIGATDLPLSGAGHPARRNVRRCPAGGRGVSSAGYSFFTSTYQAAACSSRWLLRPASIWASRR